MRTRCRELRVSMSVTVVLARNLPALADAGLRQPAGKLADIPGRIRWGKEPGMESRLQGRLDRVDFLVGHGVAHQAARTQQFVAALGRRERRAIVVKVQDAAPLQIEVDVLALGDLKENFRA